MPLPIPGPGRPPVFTDPEAMLRKGEEYFELRKSEHKVFTISGLALHLGLSGHEALAEYQRRPAFSAIVKSLKSRIINQGEERLYDKETVNGAKFHLNVLGMREVTEVVQTSQNTNLNVNAAAVLEHLNDDQLGKLAEAIALIANAGADRGGEGAQETQQDSLSLPGPGTAAP